MDELHFNWDFDSLFHMELGMVPEFPCSQRGTPQRNGVKLVLCQWCRAQPIGGDWLEVLRECDFTTSSDVVWFEMTTMVVRIRCVSMSLYFAFF